MLISSSPLQSTRFNSKLSVMNESLRSLLQTKQKLACYFKFTGIDRDVVRNWASCLTPYLQSNLEKKLMS